MVLARAATTTAATADRPAMASHAMPMSATSSAMAAARKANAARSTIRWPMRIGSPVLPARKVIAQRRARRALKAIAVPRVPMVIAAQPGLREIAVRLGLRAIPVANVGLAAEAVALVAAQVARVRTRAKCFD